MPDWHRPLTQLLEVEDTVSGLPWTVREDEDEVQVSVPLAATVRSALG